MASGDWLGFQGGLVNIIGKYKHIYANAYNANATPFLTMCFLERERELFFGSQRKGEPIGTRQEKEPNDILSLSLAH